MKPSVMATNDNILISLDSRHAKKIYAGTKKVELRRRPMGVTPGTTMWLYEKVPVGSITGCATVKAAYVASPVHLWYRFGSVSGLSRDEFFAYFADVNEGCAVELEDISQLQYPVSLAQLRQLMSSFQPPQFFIRLPRLHPILVALKACGKSPNQYAKASVITSRELLVA